MLQSVLNILEGLAPQALRLDSAEFLDGLGQLLGRLVQRPGPMVHLVQACIVSLAVARGTCAHLVKAALVVLATSGPHTTAVPVPAILRVLQDVTETNVLPDQNLSWCNSRPSSRSAVEAWDLHAESAGALQPLPDAPVVEWACLAARGGYLYLQLPHLLAKIGTGFNGSVRSAVLAMVHTPPTPKPVWIGFLNVRDADASHHHAACSIAARMTFLPSRRLPMHTRMYTHARPPARCAVRYPALLELSWR